MRVYFIGINFQQEPIVWEIQEEGKAVCLYQSIEGKSFDKERVNYFFHRHYKLIDIQNEQALVSNLDDFQEDFRLCHLSSKLHLESSVKLRLSNGFKEMFKSAGNSMSPRISPSSSSSSKLDTSHWSSTTAKVPRLFKSNSGQTKKKFSPRLGLSAKLTPRKGEHQVSKSVVTSDAPQKIRRRKDSKLAMDAEKPQVPLKPLFFPQAEKKLALEFRTLMETHVGETLCYFDFTDKVHSELNRASQYGIMSDQYLLNYMTIRLKNARIYPLYKYQLLLLEEVMNQVAGTMEGLYQEAYFQAKAYEEQSLISLRKYFEPSLEWLFTNLSEYCKKFERNDIGKESALKRIQEEFKFDISLIFEPLLADYFEKDYPAAYQKVKTLKEVFSTGGVSDDRTEYHNLCLLLFDKIADKAWEPVREMKSYLRSAVMEAMNQTANKKETDFEGAHMAAQRSIVNKPPMVFQEQAYKQRRTRVSFMLERLVSLVIENERSSVQAPKWLVELRRLHTKEEREQFKKLFTIIEQNTLLLGKMIYELDQLVLQAVDGKKGEKMLDLALYLDQMDAAEKKVYQFLTDFGWNMEERVAALHTERARLSNLDGEYYSLKQLIHHLLDKNKLLFACKSLSAEVILTDILALVKQFLTQKSRDYNYTNHQSQDRILPANLDGDDFYLIPNWFYALQKEIEAHLGQSKLSKRHSLKEKEVLRLMDSLSEKIVSVLDSLLEKQRIALEVDCSENEGDASCAMGTGCSFRA